MPESAKPGRPFGVTLAIVTSVTLFVLFPLVRVGLILLVKNRIYFEDGVASGTDVLGVENVALVIQTLLGIVFMVVAFFAWRGRPAYMRSVLALSVLGLMAVSVIFSLLPALIEPACTQLPCDSSGEFNQQLACVQLPLTLLIPVYVLWYLNRGPARAFYRGYYLPDPEATSDNQTTA